jgi:hypothetical protein
MSILRFIDFVNESYSVNESGVPLYRGTNFDPERTIKRNRLLPELQDILAQVMSGDLSEVTVLADIPTQGKNAPQYIKDIYAEMGMKSPDEEVDDSGDDIYDPETDTYTRRSGMGDDTERNIFVDSEFLVKDIDMTKGVIIGIPYSLRKKNVMVELDPETIDEVFVK